MDEDELLIVEYVVKQVRELDYDKIYRTSFLWL